MTQTLASAGVAGAVAQGGGVVSAAGEIAWGVAGVLLPVVLLVGAGYVIARRGTICLKTMTVLNFWAAIPAMIFVAVLEAEMAAGIVGLATAVTVARSFGMGALGWVLAKRGGLDEGAKLATGLSCGLANSGNVGVPVQAIAFRGDPTAQALAVAVQTVIMVTQNFLTFSIGLALAAPKEDTRSLPARLSGLVLQPPIWALAAALAAVGVRAWSPGAFKLIGGVLEPAWIALKYGRDSFILIALVTLGAQLANVRGEGPAPGTRIVVLAQLVIEPLLLAGLLALLPVRGVEAQALLVAAAMPAAINAMLLCLQAGRGASTAARAVFWTTLLCPITIGAAVAAARMGFFAG